MFYIESRRRYVKFYIVKEGSEERGSLELSSREIFFFFFSCLILTESFLWYSLFIYIVMRRVWFGFVVVVSPFPTLTD